MKKRLAIIAGGLLAAVAVSAPAFAQKQGGTLRVTHRDNPPSASIHEEATISTNMPFMSVFNNLVMFDPKEDQQPRQDRARPRRELVVERQQDEGHVQAAQRREVARRQAVHFQGREVHVGCPARRREAGDHPQNPRKVWYKNLKEVTTNGDNEVTFTLEREQPSLHVHAGGRLFAGLSVSRRSAVMRSKPIGTGPFKVADFKRNEFIKLVRNPDYWKKGRPYLDVVEFKIVPNRSTRVLGFVAGEFDLHLRSRHHLPPSEGREGPEEGCGLRGASDERPYQSAGQSRRPAVRQSQAARGARLFDRPQAVQRHPHPGATTCGCDHAAAAGRRLGA